MLKNAEIIYSTPNGQPQNKENNLIPFVNRQIPAPQRCLDMLLAKYNGERFQTEIIMPSARRVHVPNLKCPLEKATLLLVTDGGLVPKHNPDRIPSSRSSKFGIYPIHSSNALTPGEYEVSHQGYDNTFVEADPNRLLPLDALRELEAEGHIGKIHDFFLSTSGVMTSSKQSMQLGKHIAEYVSSHPIDGVLISSACGTSTRCGSYIGLAIEEKGIPVVQITNLTRIADDFGIARVVKGYNVCCPFGNIEASAKEEYSYRKQLTSLAVDLLKLSF